MNRKARRDNRGHGRMDVKGGKGRSGEGRGVESSSSRGSLSFGRSSFRQRCKKTVAPDTVHRDKMNGKIGKLGDNSPNLFSGKLADNGDSWCLLRHGLGLKTHE